MSYLATVAEAEASGELGRQYEADRSSLGFVANYTRTFSLRPAVYAAWQQLNGAIKSGMEPRRYELATLAAARHLRSSYCALAHGRVLAANHIGEDSVRDLMADGAGSGLDAVDRAVVELATKVAADAPGITAADFAALRALGVGDPEILDVVLAVSARCFFSTVLDGTGTQADHAYESLLEPDTVEALTIGRPIAEA